MADDWGPAPTNGDNDRDRGRTASPPRESRRSRSTSPVRMQEDRRDDDRRRDDRGRGDNRGRGGDGGGTNPGNNLHVSGLSTRVEDRDLDEAFGKFGRIQKCQVMRDPHTKDSRGFAFVTMETSDEADAAIAALNATELLGRTMNVEKARRGRARTPTPGQYHGPPKREPFDSHRPYEPRGYGGGGGGGGSSRYDDRPRRYDDRDRGYGRGGGGYDDRDSFAIPMRGGGGGGGGDDRRPPRDDRRDRYDDRDRRRYDDAPRRDDRYDRRY